MILRTVFGAFLALAAVAIGVTAALGITFLPGNWPRVGLPASVVVAWALWELMMRVRVRLYGGTPPAPSPAANRMAIGIAILIGLGVVTAVALGWLNV